MVSRLATGRRPMPVVSQTVLVSPTRPVLRLITMVFLAAAGCADGSPRAAQPSPTTTAVEASTTPTNVPSTTTPPATSPPPTTSPPTTSGEPSATSAEPATVVSRGDPNRRTVALTFDAGADAGFTSDILDVLQRSDVRATFGITGRWAESHPDLVRRMASAGHLVMNHTYEHRSFTGVSARPAVLSPTERRNDVERADEIIRNLTGRTTRPWFRPPYGDYDASVNAAVGALGYRYNVLWTVDSLGWQGLSPSAIARRCLAGAAPGAILLFPVGSQSQDAASLPEIITGLRVAGYGFGTVADVISE